MMNMKIKKILCIVLAFAMICLLAACGGDAADNDKGGENPSDGAGPDGGLPGDNSGSGGSNLGDGGSGGNAGGNLGNTGGGGDTGREPGSGGDGSDPGGGEGAGNPGDGSGAGGGDNSGSGAGGGDNGGGGNSGGGGDSGNTGGGGSGSGGGNNSNLTGTPEEILSKLVADIEAAGVDMPMSFPPSEVTLELSQNTIGLSEADFTKLVVSAAYNMAAIGTFAHQIIMIQATDANAALEVKKLVSGSNGYDPQKWICVFPEVAATVESGSYVLLIAARSEVVDAAITAFRSAAGNIGDVNRFWEHAGGEIEGGGFGGGEPIIIG